MTATATRVYSPSRLRLLADTCPRALDHHERREPRDRDGFDVGVVAHAVLEDVGREARRRGSALDEESLAEVAEGTVRRLLTEGRSHEGTTEPPPRPEAAWEGRDLAIRWARQWPILPDAHHELRVAFDREWQPVPWGDERQRFRLVLDCAYPVLDVDEEGHGGRVLVVRDYKTAWPAGEADLDSLQMRAQAVAAYSAIEAGAGAEELVHEVAGIRLEIANLRTLQVHRRDLDPWLDTDDRELVERWQRDLTVLMDACDEQVVDGVRPARPGGGCLRCPYVERCAPAWEWLDASGVKRGDELARSYVMAEALRTALGKRLREELRDTEPVEVDDDTVGYQRRETRVPADHAVDVAWERWCHVGGVDPGSETVPAGVARGLFVAARMGKTQLEWIAKAVHPQRSAKGERDELLETMTEPSAQAVFGIQRKKP